MGVRKMVSRNRHNITNPDIAVRLFRFWCQNRRLTPEYATIEDLAEFGDSLMQDGYSPDEVDRCRYIVFNHL